MSLIVLITVFKSFDNLGLLCVATTTQSSSNKLVKSSYYFLLNTFVQNYGIIIMILLS